MTDQQLERTGGATADLFSLPTDQANDCVVHHCRVVGLTSPTILVELVEEVALSEASLARDLGQRAVLFTRTGITRDKEWMAPTSQ